MTTPSTDVPKPTTDMTPPERVAYLRAFLEGDGERWIDKSEALWLCEQIDGVRAPSEVSNG